MNERVESRTYLPQAEFSGKCAEIVNALSSPERPDRLRAW